MDLENGEGEGRGVRVTIQQLRIVFPISWLHLAAEYESCSQ